MTRPAPFYVFLLLTLFGAVRAAAQRAADSFDYDIVIRNGRVLDGAGNPWIAADVAIRDGRFAVIGRVAGRGRREIDARGKYVSPGWIDMMDQSGAVLRRNPLAENKLRMGVTTAVGGEGGPPVPVDSMAAYFRQLETEGISINFGTYVSHGQARGPVIGNRSRPPAADELERMKAIMARAMEAGALGMSTALIYPPLSYTTTDELVETAKIAAAYGGIYASHIRGEGRELLEAVGEAIEIGERAGLPVEIFHLKAAYEPGWGTLMPAAGALIDAARARGVEVAADLYPYTAGGTGLEATIPSWAHEGGRDSLRARLARPETRARLKRELETGSPGWWNIVEASGGWDRIVLVNARNEENARFVGQNIAEIARATGRDPADAAWDLVTEGRGRVMAIYHMMAEQDIETALKFPWVSIGSDAGAALEAGTTDNLGLPHPRSYGTFPRVIARYVKERGVLALPEAIRMMTSWPATRMRLDDRGVIRAGLWADVVVFDLDQLRDRATYDEPVLFPEGIEYVLVNGRIVIDQGRHTGERPGQVLYGPGRKQAASAQTHAAVTSTQAAADVAPAPGYEEVARALERLIEHERRDKDLPAVSIALVDDQRIVWARGFGEARPDGTPATAATVHRVGSVSKLFTDIAVMQLVERGELDLDADVSRYAPAFRPNTATPVTLRQLMSHRSGLQREPPVGHYFDDTEPSLAATIASLRGRDLVHPPGSTTKYSNAGIALVGYVLETMKGEPFAHYLHRSVLVPLGIGKSAFEPTPHVRDNLATAYMWTWDGRRFEAPTFELGMAPAGSMYASVLDLGTFLSALFAGGMGESGRVLKPETLEQMWTPQYAPPGQRTGYGIGFGIGELEGRRRIGHGGAIYGFATDLAALPEERLGAAVVITLDVTNAVAQRITDAALRLMLAAGRGEPLPEIRTPAPVSLERARALAGRYANARRSIDLVVRSDELRVRLPGTYALRAFGDTLVIDDRAAFGTRLRPLDDDRIVLGRDTLLRTTAPRPPPPPAAWDGLIGEYGWDHNTLYIYEDAGRLHALIEWFFPYVLEQESENVFAFPAHGLYSGEKLIFARDAAGRAASVEAAGVVFERRAVGAESGETFRIAPARPVTELRAAALAARPPAETGEFLEADLVELRSLDPTIRYDIRYASTNNFMSAVFYTEAKAFLQRPAAEALVRAHRRLREHGYGLLIHDAYRPWYVTKMFWDATPQEFKHFVADPAQGSRHNRGAAVDLTLYDLATGEVVEMVGGYDEFSERSYPDYPGGTARQRWHRELLRQAMEAEGFDVYEFEWWHFDYRDWRRYRIGNQTFEQIARS